MSDVVPVVIRILDKEYRIACPEEEHAALVESAQYLHRRMKELRDSGKVIGADRIAVMAALNIAHELLQYKSGRDERSREVRARLSALQDKVERAVSNGGAAPEL
jgi:cell division protein ZapA